VGAINITTRKPGAEFEGQVLADIGDYDQQRYGALLSGPLGDQLAGKISVVHNERDGFLDNTYGGTVNTVDYDTGRAQLLWNANEDLEFLLTGNYRKDESDGNNLVTRDQWLPLDKDYEVSIPDPGFEDVEASGGSLRITYDWCDYLLTSITSADKIDEDYQNDQDWSPLEALTGFDTRNSEQWSQELRIASPGDGPLTWVGGLYFFHQEFDATQEAVNGPDTIFAAIGLTSLIGTGTMPSDVLPFLPDYVPIKADSTIEVDSYAAYANADYAFNEQWSLSAGLRYSDDRKDLDYVQTTHPLAVAVGFLPIDLEDEVDDSEWTPTVSLNWHPAEDVLAYVKYSRGYKAGGFNNSVSTSASAVAFEAETMDAYELGLKSQWLDQRLQLNAAVFHMEYDDKQESAFVAGAGYRQTNAGKAVSDGFEMELQFAATSDWLIYGAVGYADSEYDEYVVDATTDYGGNTLTRAPEWTFNMGTQAEWEFTDYLRGSFRLDYSYQDEFFTQADNDPFFAGDSQNLVNARLGISDAGKNWEATLWGRNLTDDDNINTIDGPSTFFFETYHYSLIAPRTYGVELKYNF
jgi:iron complex outermembrane receptor protein